MLKHIISGIVSILWTAKQDKNNYCFGPKGWHRLMLNSKNMMLCHQCLFNSWGGKIHCGQSNTWMCYFVKLCITLVYCSHLCLFHKISPLSGCSRKVKLNIAEWANCCIVLTSCVAHCSILYKVHAINRQWGEGDICKRPSSGPWAKLIFI